MHIPLTTLLFCTASTTAPALHWPGRAKPTAQKNLGFPLHLSLRANNWALEIPCFCDWAPLQACAAEMCLDLWVSLWCASVSCIESRGIFFFFPLLRCEDGVTYCCRYSKDVVESEVCEKCKPWVIGCLETFEHSS
jgi:hypothetical protein